MLPSLHDIPVIEFEIVKVEDLLSESLPFQVCKICILGEKKRKKRQEIPSRYYKLYLFKIDICLRTFPLRMQVFFLCSPFSSSCKFGCERETTFPLQDNCRRRQGQEDQQEEQRQGQHDNSAPSEQYCYNSEIGRARAFFPTFTLSFVSIRYRGKKF